jgi:hypothetical protein
MALGDIAGIGQLKESLAVTNNHLEAVLRELQETNRIRLDRVTAELQRVNANLEAIREAGLLPSGEITSA